MIEIVPPRQSWTAEFRPLKQVLRSLAPPGATIHHIGSTAVPGLAAKDVIDIQVSVDRLSDIDCAALEQAGFVGRYDLVDHSPPGLNLAEAELRKLFFRGPGRAANIHIRERGRFNQRFALVTRDFLRAHPMAASAYGQIKQSLARRFPTDVDAYYEIKDPLFDIILVGAEVWADHVGWSEPPGD